MRIWNRLRRWVRRRQFEAELEEEIRLHREMEREYRASGGEGRHFGSAALALEESREAWGFGWLDSLLQDIRYAWRGILKSPGFALTVIGTIGLALGINTTLFTVFNTYVFRTVAVTDPYGLYEFWWESKDGNGRATWPQFQAARHDIGVFIDVAAYEYLFGSLEDRPSIGQVVSGNYFALLGPGTQLGRLIEPGDSDVVVLSDSCWRNWFGGDPKILGRKLRLRGQVLEVIGVAPPAFGGVGDVVMDFWVKGTPPTVRLLGRLKPGITPEAARGAVLAWAKPNTAGLAAERRATGARIVSRATPIEYSAEMAATLSPVFAAFGLVLAIACANVSNMMLARALSRQREMAIRVSLGAGRARLVRQLLTESLLLALPAAAVGIVISRATMQSAVWLLLHTLPPAFAGMLRIPALENDWRVFAFVLLASAGAALLFGLVPALQTTRSRLVEANRGDFSSDHRPARLRSLLIAGQVAVCVLLTICSGVALRSQQRVSRQDIRMRTGGVFSLVLSKGLRPSGVERLRAAPGIEAVAAAWRAPLYSELVKLAVVPGGRKEDVRAGYNFVSPEYFSLLRIPLLRGRIFRDDEARSGADVVVISESTARRFWPGQEALGETIAIPAKWQADRRSDRLPTYSSARVIGVVGDVITGFAAVGIDPTCLYFPTTAGTGAESLLVGVTGGKAAGHRDIQTALDQILPGLADQINPMDEVRAAMVYPFRIAFWIAGFLGGLAILLTVSGIYGVLSYVVSQRTKEIGIRMALGADTGAVVRMVVSQSMRLVAIGTAAGTGLALALAPLFANQVEAVEPYDATAYLGAVLLVAAAAAAASWRPAQRAVAVDPLAALRCD